MALVTVETIFSCTTLIIIILNVFFSARNICHGSDGVESAKKEIDLWFNKEEQVSWEPVEHEWLYE